MQMSTTIASGILPLWAQDSYAVWKSLKSLEILEKFGISKVSLQDLEKSCDSAKLMKLS
jgi:hypothetical protein